MSSLSCKFASIVALPGMALLSSCGEVKVIKNNSFISSMNPVNEVVEVTIDKTSEIPVSCLNIKEPTFEPGLSVSDVERDVFNRAVIAHLAPIQIPIKEECRFAFQLQVAEYDIQTLLVASRLIVSLSAEIADDFDQSPVWASQYRLTQNAGAIPLDPISMGFGAIAQVVSKNSQSFPVMFCDKESQARIVLLDRCSPYRIKSALRLASSIALAQALDSEVSGPNFSLAVV